MVISGEVLAKASSPLVLSGLVCFGIKPISVYICYYIIYMFVKIF